MTDELEQFCRNCGEDHNITTCWRLTPAEQLWYGILFNRREEEEDGT